jgi:hypothetical protein
VKVMENLRARGGQLGTAGLLSLSAQGVHGVMPAEAAQLEMADLNDWFGNFDGESVGHEEGSADVLAEEFQPAEYVDVAPNGGEVEAVARANIAVGGIAVVQGDIDGNMLLDLLRRSLERGQCRLCCS